MEKKEEKIIERARKAIPGGIARKLWVKSAGRCEYNSCNIPLWKDNLTQKDMNKAYISHIIAAKENGPRGDKELSEKLELEFENLMLLCDECHNRIDESQKDSHSVTMLQTMKKEHEDRIEILTDYKKDKRSQIIHYRANIGEHTPLINYEVSRDALISNGYFPSSQNAIDLGLENSPFRDKNASFWDIELENLTTKFEESIKPLLRRTKLNHISLFGIAPIPLLIKLGALVNDIQNVRIYQPHRNPKTWEWLEHLLPLEFEVDRPDVIHQKVALNLSLSATINNDRIYEVLGRDCSIYTITLRDTFNDILKSYEQFVTFQPIVQKLLNEIKYKHGQNNEIHVFPAMQPAFAIEFGRVRMPKADLPFILYDQIIPNNPFVKIFKID
jgi:hypothetical protein